MMNRINTRGQNGFSILEVVIGIFIFVVGLLALSSLQGALTRSMADAKVRTTAANIAERLIENQRGFTRLLSDTANPKTFIAYSDIVTSDTTEDVNGITYTIDMDVTDYYYQLAGDNFTTTTTGISSLSTYKQVEITVFWDKLGGAAQNFRADEGTELIADDLGSGNIKLTATIPALVTSASARVADESSDGDRLTPPVSYIPGENPDVISLAMGPNKFKETLTPEPKVYRNNELVETRFDVVTYSTLNGTNFLRREEFVSLSCECELKAPPGDPVNAGRRPTIWAGDEYSEALFADKPYGVSNRGRQSKFCDVCCQDHHDGGTPAGGTEAAEAATRKYDPFPNSSREYWSSGPFAGDHKHYFPNDSGVLTEVASDDGTYMESCALVRKDGFMRVIQDFNQEGVNLFAQDFLDDDNEALVYGNYVTGAVSTYVADVVADESPGYESSPPTLAPATGLWPDTTTLPLLDASGADINTGNVSPDPEPGKQQLRNRGIYISYISNNLQAVIECIQEGSTTPTSDCESGDVKLDQTGSTNVLELLPFFEVQLTLLSRWNEIPINNPVDTTNEPVKSDNLHSRGLASPGGRKGLSLVLAKGHPGNIGLTDTRPIEPNFTITSADITVESLTGDPPIDPAIYTVVSGTITSSIGGDLNVTDVVVVGTNAECDRTVDGFTCYFIAGSVPTITVSGYGGNISVIDPITLVETITFIERVACGSSGLTTINQSSTGIDSYAILNLEGLSEAILHNINIIPGTVCPGGGFGG